jgi:hypothetical protein
MISPRSTLRRLSPVLVGAGLAAGILATGATSPASATSSTGATPRAGYTFQTLDNQHDSTFNQLLSINDAGVIAGYFGSGMPAKTHPNRGYLLVGPYGQRNYVNENFPGAQQTQVTGINDSGTTVGFYADSEGDNFGFVLKAGIWTVAIDPHTTGTVNQLLGLNNKGVAVGFYTDSKGNAHAYKFNFHADTFSAIDVPGATSSTATGINASGDISGFYTKGGTTRGFLLKNGVLTSFSVGGSTNTMALGLNNSDVVVGSWAGKGTIVHGFVWSNGKATTLDDPNGPGATTIQGINSSGDLVGFYSDSTGNVDGFVATR